MKIKEIQNLIKFVAKSGAQEVRLEMESMAIINNILCLFIQIKYDSHTVYNIFFPHNTKNVKNFPFFYSSEYKNQKRSIFI